MKTKKVIGIIIAAAMLLSLMYTFAFAETITSSETITAKVNEPCDAVTKIDNAATYTEIELIGELPEGLDWRYGEVQDPYFSGTPTKEGTYEVTFKCFMYESEDIIEHTVTIIVEGAKTIKSSETVSVKVNEAAKASTKIDNKATYTKVDLIGELPEGLTWGYGEAEDPYIQGTPTKTGTYNVTFKCQMYETTDIIEHAVTIVVEGADTSKSGETFKAKVNEACKLVTKINNKATYTNVDLIGELPEGMDWGYGEVQDPYIQGTPVKAGTYEVTFKCSMYETEDKIEHTVTIVVEGADVYSSNETFKSKVNEACKFETKINNKATYTTVDLIGELPEGMDWGYGEAEDPYIQGTPTKAGTYKVTFRCNMYETSDVIEHTVTIKVTDPNAPEEVEELENPFVDIKEDSYYYDAVLWAYNSEPQVTKGVDETHFGPNKTVTRGQTVTFLWRAMGEPEPANSKNPFADVKKDDYYYKAVLWAVEKGITQGTDATHFSPDKTCSTAHITTFLYRTLEIGEDGWYEKAAKWAEDNGLLKDINKKVAPDVNCPRADVVTFLYRTVGK